MKRPSRGFWRTGLIASVLVTGAAHLTSSFPPGIQAQEPAKVEQGLRGLLPEGVPPGLYEDDFQTLGESWKDWATGTASEVLKFYTDETLDVAGQKASLETLRRKLNTMKTALSDPRYAAIFKELSTMHSRLGRRVDIAQAALDTLEQHPETAWQERVKAAGQEVATAVDQLDGYLKGMNNGSAWLKFVKADDVRKVAAGNASLEVLVSVKEKLSETGKLPSEEQRNFVQRAQFSRLRESLDEYLQLAGGSAPMVDQAGLRTALKELIGSIESFEESRSSEDAAAIRKTFSKVRRLAADGGERIADAMSSHYFNYNLRVVVSEAFANKVAAQPVSETGPVDDFILGAKVDGTQVTTGNVVVDVLPSDSGLKFAMNFNGVSQTSTQGVTDQATIFTSGYHQFSASKQITFDGDRFTTFPATIWVQANNTTTGARTGVSGLPIFGSIADDYAVSEARKRKSRSEAIAADKLRNRLLPQFNQEVDAEFAKHTEAMLNKVIPKLHENQLYPSARSFRSTDSELWISTRLMESAELGGDTPILTATTSTGAAIHLHETLLNNSLDRLRLHGRTMTEDELASELAKSFSNLLGREIKLPAKKDGEQSDGTKFIFPDQDPLRVQISGGELSLVLRAGLQPPEGEAIPTHAITVPLTFTIDGSNIRIEAGSIGVAAVEGGMANIARAGVIRAKLQKALPTREVDRFITMNRNSGGPVNLAIAQITPNAGWLSIVIE